MSLVASVMLVLTLQAGMPDSVPVKGEPGPGELLGGRTLIITHLLGVGHPGSRVDRGDTLGTIEPYPAQLSKRHQPVIDSASADYARRDYAGAAALLAPVYADEPDNPFVENEYARTLFWIEDRRGESFDIYRRLIAQLDRQNGTNDRQVAVDAWFSESYWKIGSLYLDRQDWQDAALEIARFLAVRGNAGPAALTQVYTFLAEACSHLNHPDLTRWAAEQALRADPRNSEAIEFLRGLGPATHAWPANHVFSCRVVADSLPCIGGYSFHRGANGLLCTAPREEPRTPLSPCLRVGWIYVGQPRQSVEAVLGEPWKASVPERGDGTETDAYLVFADGNVGSYYVVEYEQLGTDQIAHSVQFTGDITPLPTDFSGLRLADSSDRVLRQLGDPEATGNFDDQERGIKGVWWDWTSAGISVEIVADKLYSVRLFRPRGVTAARIVRDFMRFH